VHPEGRSTLTQCRIRCLPIDGRENHTSANTAESERGIDACESLAVYSACESLGFYRLSGWLVVRALAEPIKEHGGRLFAGSKALDRLLADLVKLLLKGIAEAWGRKVVRLCSSDPSLLRVRVAVQKLFR